MTDEQKKVLVKRMGENLEILRIKLGIKQEELGEMIGVSRFTITAIENQKREMTWNTFLSLLMVFTKNTQTDELLTVFKIYTEELDVMFKK